tara:strand:+ start:103 stop:276 length:174 start_codon:yes stop_codon:yes gene_type:complete
VKVGDLVKGTEGYMGHEGGGIGLVLFTDGIIAKVKWQGDYGTFMQDVKALEVISEAR